MNLERVFNIAGLLIGVATITVVLGSPQTARIIQASGSAFTSSLRAAMGR